MTNNTNMLIYKMEDGKTKIDVRLENETVWMTQKAIAELYQKNINTINDHIKNIIDEGELEERKVIRKDPIVKVEGKRTVKREISFYNLEMIIAIGYRVKSQYGTQFRRWATERLNEYLVKGFTMDDERLKSMKNFGKDYFDELLERIRDIRTSEKRFYKKITDIYALSIDYEPNSKQARHFFATVQNKLHFAIHGHTAAELIELRADANKDNMGLKTWKGNKVRKGDIVVAKNYLNENEIKELKRIVTMFLDYAEDQAERKNPINMKDWDEKLNLFLRFNEREILTNIGNISHDLAKQLVYKEYEKFNKNRLDTPKKDDFDKYLEENSLVNKK